MMTLDLGHGELLCEENRSLGFIEKFPERIKHVHLHDNRGGNSPTDDLHLPPGEGWLTSWGCLKRCTGFTMLAQ